MKLPRYLLFIFIVALVMVVSMLIAITANASVTPNVTAFGASTTWGWGAGSTGYAAGHGTEGFSYPYQLRHLYGWKSANMGIVGDQLTRKTSHDPYGNGVLRFEAYVTAIKHGKVARPTAIVIWDGNNDVSSTDYNSATPSQEAGRVVAAYRQILSSADNAQIPVYLMTLQPDQWKASEPREQARELVNRWIRQGHGAAGYIDADKAVRGATDTVAATAYKADSHGPGPNPQGSPHLNPIGYDLVAVAVHNALITG